MPEAKAAAAWVSERFMSPQRVNERRRGPCRLGGPRDRAARPLLCSGADAMGISRRGHDSRVCTRGRAVASGCADETASRDAMEKSWRGPGDEGEGRAADPRSFVDRGAVW